MVVGYGWVALGAAQIDKLQVPRKLRVQLGLMISQAPQQRPTAAQCVAQGSLWPVTGGGAKVLSLHHFLSLAGPDFRSTVWVLAPARPGTAAD